MGICGGVSGASTIACGAKGEGSAVVSAADHSARAAQDARVVRASLRTQRFLKHGRAADNTGFARACGRGGRGDDGRMTKTVFGAVVVICTGLAGCDGEVKRPDVGFVPTPPAAVARMIEMAELQPGDTVFDLGCGDGRIVVAAAQAQRVRAVGVDINPERVAESQAAVRAAGLEGSVEIRQADIFTLDLSAADVVFLYLTPRLNARLMPQLRRLKPGARIISYEFDMGAAVPVEEVRERFDEFGEQRIYKWVVPWEESEGAGWDIFRMAP